MKYVHAFYAEHYLYTFSNKVYYYYFYRHNVSEVDSTTKYVPSKPNYTPIIIGAVIAVIGGVVGIAGFITACITITLSKRLSKDSLIC